ncbi:MAG: DNA-binding protein WhiA [Clostridiales bacterium]|nr:DNA-binding protein WhiA [Clostridiales bacterium]
MSFSAVVKDELSRQCPPARHCQLAETAAILSMCGRIIIDEDDKFSIKIHTESVSVARKYFTLLKKSFNINSDVSVRCNYYLKKRRTYIVTVPDDKMAHKILYATRLMTRDGEFSEDFSVSDHVLIQNQCCMRAFLRGSFLAGGSVSDPQKTYHFEISCSSNEKALQLLQLMAQFNIEGKIIVRKRHYIVYIKEGAQIVDMLNVMGAYNSLMDMENVRILKEMRNSVNRRVNCETANINKTVSAAVKQVEDITLIRDSIGFSQLSDGLREIAQLRLDYPEATLVELGRMLSSPVGKSGVNHRLRKLGMMADELRCHGR